MAEKVTSINVNVKALNLKKILKALEPKMSDILSEIVRRTRSGRDIENGKLRRYSDSYRRQIARAISGSLSAERAASGRVASHRGAVRRRTRGRGGLRKVSSTPNLTVSGALLDSLRMKKDSKGISLRFGGRKSSISHSQLAKKLQDMGFEFFGLSKKNIKDIMKVVDLVILGMLEDDLIKTKR